MNSEEMLKFTYKIPIKLKDKDGNEAEFLLKPITFKQLSEYMPAFASAKEDKKKAAETLPVIRELWIDIFVNSYPTIKKEILTDLVDCNIDQLLDKFPSLLPEMFRK